MSTPAAPRVTTSVCTLVRHRTAHLRAMAARLEEQTQGDFELVVAYMQRARPAVPPSRRFETRFVHVPGARLQLAEARNAAARAARGTRLIFLDVDCLPSPSLVAHYGRHLAEHDDCAMGEVRYLPHLECRTVLSSAFEDLVTVAARHPARTRFPDQGFRPEADPRQLWGLSFALRAARYRAAGGMDAGYHGYGGEETDFAERLRASGTRFVWLADTLALHQHHPIASPPLDRFDDILRNAQLFRRTWGSWCMEYWLEAFERLGLITWHRDRDRLTVLRYPSPREVADSRLDRSVAFPV